jgi:hypothetical protein
MNMNSTWSALLECEHILDNEYIFPAMFKLADELALAPGWLSWMPAAGMFWDEPFTIEQFMRVLPYGLAHLNEERLNAAVQKGYLTADGEGNFRAAESGKEAVRMTYEAWDQSLAHLQILPDERRQRLVGHVFELVEATFAATKPPANVIFSHKRDNMRPYRAKGWIVQFQEYVGELEGFYGDCAITALQALGVEGHTWDALDLLSREGVLTFDELHEKIGGEDVLQTGVTREIHAGDVRELARRGWVDDASGKIQITAAGKQVRAEVEAETERLFFAPWSCLSESEVDELASLAGQLRDGLKNVKG